MPGTPQIWPLYPSCMQSAVLDLLEFETRQQHRGPKLEAEIITAPMRKHHGPDTCEAVHILVRIHERLKRPLQQKSKICHTALKVSTQMKKLIQRHWRSNWEASSMLETVTQQLLPHWGPLLSRRCHTQHTIVFFLIPCRELAAQPISTCKESRVTRSRDESIHHYYTDTHTPRCPWKI